MGERRKKQDLALVHKLVREGQEAPMLVPIPEVENRKTTTSKDAFKRMLRQQQAAH
jgi:hypothetical protein